MKKGELLKDGPINIFDIVSNPEKVEPQLALLAERKYLPSIIGVSTRTLTHWDSQGLLPYEFPDKQWRKFSFYELVWLKCIERYRALGVSIERVKMVKEHLFSLGGLSYLHVYFGLYGYMEQMKMPVPSDRELDTVTEAALKERWEPLQPSVFAALVITVLAQKQQLHFVLDDTDEFVFVDFLGTNSRIPNNKESVERILGKSFISLNLQQLAEEVLFARKFEGKADLYASFLTADEYLLFKAIRSGEFHSIIVELKGKEIKSLKEVQQELNISERELFNRIRHATDGDFNLKKRQGRYPFFEKTKKKERSTEG